MEIFLILVILHEILVYQYCYIHFDLIMDVVLVDSLSAKVNLF